MAIMGIGNIRNNWKTNATAQAVAEYIHRGYATQEKVKIVLNDLKENFEIKHLKQINNVIAEKYAEHIAERVENGEITGKTGATYISALNAIIEYSNHFFNAETEKINYSEFDIHKETDYTQRAISEDQHNSFLSHLSEQFKETQDDRFERLSMAVELQREFGLRFRESIGLNQETIQQGLGTGKLELGRDDWTKNAREREIPITSEQQRELLNRVSEYFEQKGIVNLAGAENSEQIRDHSIIQEFRNFAYGVAQEQDFSFHGERHFYAQERFSELWKEKTGVELQSPIEYYSGKLEASGWSGEGNFYDAVKEYEITLWWEYAQEETGLSMPELKEIDHDIRMEISEELGHSRIDITNVYLGHP